MPGAPTHEAKSAISLAWLVRSARVAGGTRPTVGNAGLAELRGDLVSPFASALLRAWRSELHGAQAQCEHPLNGGAETGAHGCEHSHRHLAF
jgi:hypothetical protein